MKKLFALTAVLTAALIASWSPSAEAVGYCSASYCAGKPPLSLCGCPPGSPRFGQAVACGLWEYGCWRE